MSTMLKRKIDEQNKLWTRMQEIQSAAEKEGRDWTAEERVNWDAANTDIDIVSADIERLERMANLESVDYRQVLQGSGTDEPGDTGGSAEERETAAYETAFGQFVRGGTDFCTAEQRQLLLAHRAESRDLGVTTPSAGGYLVPPGYRAVMTETMKAFGGLINFANVITTSTGNPLQWPTNDDTGNIGAILAENTVIPTQDVVIGTRAIGAYTYTSKLVRVSLQLLQDSAFNIDTWLPRKLGQRIGRAVADHLVNGTGTGMPTGILPSATNFTGTAIGLAAFLANTSGATYNAVIDLEHSVDPAYRQAGACRFIFNDNTLAVLRKCKDTQQRPLWLPVPVPGMPATINGLPYTIDQAMPNAANPAKVMLFGDFNAGYVVRQVLDVQAVRLAERYADFLQVGFFGFMRLDALPDDAAAVRALNISGA